MTEKIILDAEPQDIAQALKKFNNIPDSYEIKEFTYSLSRIKDNNMLPELVNYKITHCRLELIKQGEL